MSETAAALAAAKDILEKSKWPAAALDGGNFAPGWGVVDGRGNWLGWFRIRTPGGDATWTYSDPGGIAEKMASRWEIAPGAVPYLAGTSPT
jgi:hypothetical protein